MDRAGLLTDLAEARIAPGEVVYLERRDDDYGWRLLPPGTVLGPESAGADGSLPDAWMFYSGQWLADVPGFLEDLLAEMESMADGSDRCRWPLDQPYPHAH